VSDKNIEQIDRKEFLRTAGSTALFTFLGIGMIGCGNSTSAMDENIVGGISRRQKQKVNRVNNFMNMEKRG